MVQKIIEGYTKGDVFPWANYARRRDNRYADRANHYRTLGPLITTHDTLANTSNTEIPWINRQIPIKTNQIYTTRNEISRYKRDISSLKRQNSNLNFDNKTHTGTIDKLRYKVPIQETEYDNEHNKTHAKLNEILPLKKKEMVGANKYYKLLMYQTEEIKDEIYSQKDNLTTADRNYSVHDSKIPYYVVVNKFLLFAYIAVLLYVSYRVLNGMIVDNIYGKIVIILLIALYPIYIFDLEMVIYDQYKLIKSMIRAEPYKPVVI
jgi:hypothetical protein